MNEYMAHTGTSAIALAAATAKSILSIVSPIDKVHRLLEIGAFFDGVTAARVPVLVELCSSDGTTDGTITDADIEVQIGGLAVVAEAAGNGNYSVEPTVLTVLQPFLVDPDRGSLIYKIPEVRDIEQHTTPGILVLRCTAPDIVNVRAYMKWGERV